VQLCRVFNGEGEFLAPLRIGILLDHLRPQLLLAACAPALAPREESIGLAGWCAADVPLKKVAAPGPHEEVPPGCGQEAAGRIAVAGKRLFLGAEEEHGIEAEGCPRRAPGARDRVAT